MMDPPYTGPKMEARQASGSYIVEVPRELEIDKEACVYGSRWVEVESEDGGPRFQEIPLTWKDLFDPQEGDHVPHGSEHSKVIFETWGILEAFFTAQGRDDVLIVEDMKMLWADPSIARISPDIAVIFEIGDPERSRDSFNESLEGVRPSFVLEVTSKKTADFDRGDKPDVYRQAKVQECLVVDRLKSPWTITGYRLDKKKKKQLEIRPDKRKRYLAETLGVYFSIAEGGKGLVLQDAATGEIFIKPAEAREAAERRAAEEAEAREAAERRAAEEARAHQAKIQELQAKIEHLESSSD